jgi:putative cell wall-binding protein/uncharacterized protein YkwD
LTLGFGRQAAAGELSFGVNTWADAAVDDSQPQTAIAPQATAVPAVTEAPSGLQSDSLGSLADAQVIDLLADAAGGNAAQREAAIRAEWQKYVAAVYRSENRYSAEPLLTAPYGAGSLEDAYLNEAMQALNFNRFLAGLGEASMVPEANRSAQHKSLILAASNQFTHEPIKPDDMSQDFFDASAFPNGECIAAGFISLPDAVVKAWIEDSDISNIAQLGHRGILLWNANNPRFGFGEVSNPSSSYRRYYTAHAQISYGAPEFEAYAFPGGKAFPNDFISGNTGWSIYLSNKYLRPVASEITVTVSNGTKTWTINNNDKVTTANGQFFNVLSDDRTIIFRPGDVQDYSGCYTVTVNGIKLADGNSTPASLSYEVNFFQLVPDLVVNSSPAFDIPEGQVAKAIQPIDVSGAVSGGLEPYSFYASGLPRGLEIDQHTGVISGKPTRVTAAGQATITVSSNGLAAKNESRRIVINFGKVIAYDGGSGSGSGDGGGGGDGDGGGGGAGEPNDKEPNPIAVTRLAGQNRSETAALACARAFPNPNLVKAVIVATGDNFPDALAASYLAGVAGAPILLTPKNNLDNYTRAQITRLKPQTVYIAGGTGAVSAKVQEQIAALAVHPKVKRISGEDRYATALNIAREAISLDSTTPTELFLATGESFPDALAVSPFAVQKNIPVLIIPASGITTAVKQFIASNGIKAVTILGGTHAVSAKTQSALATLLGARNVSRLDGSTRYETAARIVNDLLARYQITPTVVAVGSGESFPDALSGGASLGARGGVVLLTPATSLHAAAGNSLTALLASQPQLEILGGKAAIDARVESTLKTIVAAK